VPETDDQRPAGGRRGRPPKISRDQIVDGAVRLGLDSFTMTALAAEIDVSPATLYSHVAGRGEVIQLVGSRLQTTMSGFATDATEWRAWLSDFAELVRRELGSSAATLLSAARDDPSVRIDVAEPGLRLLMDAGLSSVDAAYAVWLVVRVAITASNGSDPSFARYLDPTADLVRSASDPGEVSALRRVHDDLRAENEHDTFAFDLDVVLDGIDARLARHTTNPGHRSRQKGVRHEP